MSVRVRKSSFGAPGAAGVRPLRAGEEVQRDEFERRYDATPNLKKAELIEGIVHMAPPAVRWDHHASPHSDLMTWLGTYRSMTPGVAGGDNPSIRLDAKNEPQPDAALLILPGYGGQVKQTADDYIEGPPELVAEVSASSAVGDLSSKMRIDAGHGVREYVVWRTQDRAIDWFQAREGVYAPLEEGADGIVRSRVFPGLWLDRAAMLRGELALVLEVLRAGIATPEHDAFVSRLAAALASRSRPGQD